MLHLWKQACLLRRLSLSKSLSSSDLLLNSLTLPWTAPRKTSEAPHNGTLENSFWKGFLNNWIQEQKQAAHRYVFHCLIWFFLLEGISLRWNILNSDIMECDNRIGMASLFWLLVIIQKASLLTTNSWKQSKHQILRMPFLFLRIPLNPQSRTCLLWKGLVQVKMLIFFNGDVFWD